MVSALCRLVGGDARHLASTEIKITISDVRVHCTFVWKPVLSKYSYYRSRPDLIDYVI
jgi:hypothetical protein